MKLVIDHIDDTLCLVSDISAPAVMSALKRGTYLECCEYIQEHNPKDLTSKMCDALNAQSDPTHMGEPVLRLVGKHPALAAPYGFEEQEGVRGNARWPATRPADVYAFFQPATLPGDCPQPKEAPARSLEAHLLQVELNSTGPENPLRQRKLNRFELVALEWWRARRPMGWSSVEHVMNPTINTHTAAEAKMAAMAAELFMQACEVGQLTFEAPVQL